MKLICEQCKKEYEGKRETSKFCSDKCRKLAFQSKKISVPVVSVPSSKVSVPNKFKNFTANDLYIRISSYPADTWKNSEEFAELKKRLKSKNVENLKKERYFIPNWKNAQT